MKRHIPNLITSANLFCGCIAIGQAYAGNLAFAAALILLAAFLDFFDGLAARMLKVSSAIGAQLDSLADVVSFGVAPSTIAFSLLSTSLEDSRFAYLAFIMAIFSAIRLAKFNVDDRQTDQFIGLPTPANALFWVSLALSSWQAFNWEQGKLLAELWTELSLNPVFVISAVIILSYLLIAEIPLISLKFKNFKWKGNEYRFILLIISLIIIPIFCFAAVPIILLLYLILSIIQSSRNTK